MKIRVLRAFCVSGERQEPKSVIELPDHQARELIASGKAELAGAPKAPVKPGPMTTKTADGLVEGARRKDNDAPQ